MLDPLLESQPTEKEYAAARRWARRTAMLSILGMTSLGTALTWLITGEPSYGVFVPLAIVIWLCVPIWTRRKIATDRGDPPPRIY